MQKGMVQFDNLVITTCLTEDLAIVTVLFVQEETQQGCSNPLEQMRIILPFEI